MEELNMLSHEEVEQLKEWLAAYDKDHTIWKNGGLDCTTIESFLDEYCKKVDREILDYDIYKGWICFKTIYRILDRYFACVSYSTSYDTEVEEFYEVEKREYYKRVKVVDWVKKD